MTDSSVYRPWCIAKVFKVKDGILIAFWLIIHGLKKKGCICYLINLAGDEVFIS